MIASKRDQSYIGQTKNDDYTDQYWDKQLYFRVKVIAVTQAHMVSFSVWNFLNDARLER